MTKRERRYHQQKQLNRRLRHASHVLSCGLQNLIRSTQPVPKYPLGGERGMSVIGEPLPAFAMNIDASAFLIPPELFEPPKPVQVWAVDKEGGISQISISQMLQTLDLWAQNKQP